MASRESKKHEAKETPEHEEMESPTDEELERILAGIGGEDDEDEGNERAGGDGDDDDADDRRRKGKAMSKSVQDQMTEAVPEAYDASPVLQNLAKAMDARFDALGEGLEKALGELTGAFVRNQERVQEFGNAVSEEIAKSQAMMDGLMDLTKSMQDELEGFGGTSQRPSDAGAGLLQKSSAMDAGGPQITRELAMERLAKSVADGALDGIHITQFELGQVTPEALAVITAG